MSFTVRGEDAYTWKTVSLSQNGISIDGSCGFSAGLYLSTTGTLYATAPLANSIFSISTIGEVVAMAGSSKAGSADGTGSQAEFNSPIGIASDASGLFYVADTNNHTIRKVTAAGVVTTLAGDAGTFGGVDGTGTAAQFNHPTGVVCDASGNLYVADSGNHAIRKVSAAGVVTTIAGAGVAGGTDGSGTSARFNTPSGIAMDQAGNLIVADTGNHAIRKVTPQGVVTTLAGLLGYAGALDGNTALFSSPQGVAVDTGGNIYIADTANHTIRKISSAGQTTTIGGLAGYSGSADGTTLSRFNQPVGIAVDVYGNLRVSDVNHRIILGTAPLEISTTSPLPNGSMATAYNRTLAATGGRPPYVWSLATGTLPSGITLSSAGVLSGTPTVGKTFNFTIEVTGSDLLSTTKSFRLAVINPAAPIITSESTIISYAGEELTYQITASNGPILSYAATGLPTGLSLSNGTISGNTTQSGTFSVTLSATNAAATGSKTLLLKIYNTSAVTNRLDEFPLPLNDNFAERVSLTGAATNAIGFNYYATTETGEPAFDIGAADRSIWWKWTPSVTATVTIDTAGSDFDTFLGVATGSAVNGLVPVASNDDTNGTFQSSVTFTAYAGTEYQIKVDGSPGSGGEGMVSLQIAQNVRQVTATSTLGGIASGGGTSATGSQVTVSAIASAGYRFAAWTEEGDIVSTNATYSFVPEYDRVLLANFEVIPPLQVWRNQHFGTSENTGEAGDSADPDHDGLPNLIEYATGSLPSSTASSLPPQVGLSGNALTITFHRIADPALTYQVWATDNLSDWGETPLWTSTGQENTASEVTVSDTGFQEGQTKRFLRLRVVTE
jgi:hypothetical protein